MHRFKSAILEKLKNCQNGTFEPSRELKFFVVLGFYESLKGLEC
jgi:hypothetical protein